jgi:hypothetical protein
MFYNLLLRNLRDSELIESLIQFCSPYVDHAVFQAQHIAGHYFINTGNVLSVRLAAGQRGETNGSGLSSSMLVAMVVPLLVLLLVLSDEIACFIEYWYTGKGLLYTKIGNGLFK